MCVLYASFPPVITIQCNSCEFTVAAAASPHWWRTLTASLKPIAVKLLFLFNFFGDAVMKWKKTCGVKRCATEAILVLNTELYYEKLKLLIFATSFLWKAISPPTWLPHNELMYFKFRVTLFVKFMQFWLHIMRTL